MDIENIPPDNKSDPKTPNKDIDIAIKGLMKKIKGDIPIDMAVKVVSTAISWEKVKHQIKDTEEPWNPDTI